MKRLRIFLLFGITVFASCKKHNTPAPSIKYTYAVYNKGIYGNTSASLVSRVDTAVIALKPMLVIIMIGTNDAIRDSSLVNYRSNLSVLITKIQAANSKVLLLSPPPHGRDVINGNDQVNNRTDSITTILNTLSKTYHCYYFNMNAAFKNAGSPNPTASSMILNAANYPQMPDGIHVTLQGLTFMASNVYSSIKSNHLLPYYKIVCFGDSITLEGETESYPLQLQGLLNGD